MITTPPPQPSASYREHLPLQRMTHHGYPDEMLQYILLRDGKYEALAEAARMFTVFAPDQLSTNHLRNLRYMFVASTTLATRFAIEGGMNSDEAYDTSDRFIRSMDLARTEAEVRRLHANMFSEFLVKIQRARQRRKSNAVLNACLDYIDGHLDQKITLALLAQQVERSPNHIGQLFYQHMGVGLSTYLLHRRVDTAKSMLIHTNLTHAEIAETLAFSSQSYFIRCFQQVNGQTPAQFRANNREIFSTGT
ncbi:MAG: AraC family transcriptional regulator [Rothia sp. (in: high G+C Gram-positive bacteria)]|nr:AraC family transcriptional regulator [Rothia sp. (in: high G+C Gram-positive bacteria)]